MIPTNSAPEKSSNNGWQKVCDISLPAGSDDLRVVRLEMEEKLESLHLPLELMDRLMHSAQEMIQRTATAKAAAPPPIHFFIYVPENHASKAGPWGFFRIERIDRTDGNLPRNHAVEFYLYPEGK